MSIKGLCLQMKHVHKGTFFYIKGLQKKRIKKGYMSKKEACPQCVHF